MKQVLTFVGAFALVALAALAVAQDQKIRDLEWDKAYWRGELMRTYEPQGLLDGQCCNPRGEGCDEPILGDDC